jgi:hypothetical protein
METPVKIGFAVAILIAFAVSAKVLRDRLPEAQGSVKIVARLDEHTIKEGPAVKNAIPSFLDLPGEVGILPDPVAPPADAAAPAPAASPAPQAPAAAERVAPSSPASPGLPVPGSAPTPDAAAAPAPEAPVDKPILITDIKPLAQTELQKGYCTASLTALIRQRYPGTYEGIPDEDLEKSLLKQHPEYKGRICVFPAWITASPHTIVKYEIERGVTAIPMSLWLWSGGIAALFGVALLVAYKRLIEPINAPKPAPARSRTHPSARASQPPRKDH